MCVLACVCACTCLLEVELLEHGDANRVVQADLRLKLLDPQLGNSFGQDMVELEGQLLVTPQHPNKTVDRIDISPQASYLLALFGFAHHSTASCM